MLRPFRRFLLYWLILWLPLQSAAVFAMPLCDMAQPVRAQPVQVAEQPCHGEQGYAVQPATEAEEAAGAACEHCTPCHVVGAGFMPGVPLRTADSVSHHVQHAAPVLHVARIHLPREHRPPIFA